MKALIVFLLSCLSIHAQTRIVNANIKNATISITNSTGGGGATAFVISGHGSSQSDFFGLNSGLGYSFIPTQNITITHIGRIAKSGNTHDHVVSLISADGTTVLASTTITGVSLSGATPDTYVYNAITPVSVTIAGGGALGYIMVSDETTGDTWYDDGSALTISSGATLEWSRYLNGGGGYSLNTANRGFVLVNFKYTIP